MKSESDQKSLPGYWLSEQQLAARWQMSVKWLQKKRREGGEGAIPFAKFGKSVRYGIEDVESYERFAKRASTSDDGERS